MDMLRAGLGDFFSPGVSHSAGHPAHTQCFNSLRSFSALNKTTGHKQMHIICLSMKAVQCYLESTDIVCDNLGTLICHLFSIDYGVPDS